MIENEDQEFKREILRRLQDLEGGQRTGLASTTMSVATAGTTIVAGAAGSWQDVTMPVVTARCTYGAVVIGAIRATKIGAPTASAGFDYRAANFVAGISLDGYVPNGHPSGVNFQSQLIADVRSATPSPEFNNFALPLTFVRVVTGLEPGNHTFKMQAYSELTYAAGTTDPVASDSVMVVIPL
jgi:hypothetical protein